MKSAAFDYVRPQSLAEAIGLHAGAAGEAQLMAGGQSLVAMMNLRLAMPRLVIDIARLPELGRHDRDETAVTLGACVTHAMIEDGLVPDPSRGLMARAASGLAYRAIRTRGTIGGSLALADPAAEWPSVLVALDAEAILLGAGGERTVRCAGFVTGIYETGLAPGEIIVGLRIPVLSAASRWGYIKFARKSGEFARSLAVVVRDPARNFARVVLGAADGAPIVLARTAAALDAGEDALASAIAADLAAERGRNFDDGQRELHAIIIERAARQALA